MTQSRGVMFHHLKKQKKHKKQEITFTYSLCSCSYIYIYALCSHFEWNYNSKL